MATDPIAEPSGVTPGRVELGGFRQERVGALSDEEVAGLVAALDLQAGLPSVRQLRDWAFDRLDPRAGEVCVDVGCGTGSEVVRLSGRAGLTGRAIGIDPNPRLLQVAASRAPAGGHLEWVEGVAGQLPLPDGSVDVLRCERVFQHLTDPQAAADEFARVLRPGGRVAVLDSDWQTAVVHIGEPEIVRRIQEWSWTVQPNPFAGRHLSAQLSATGLSVDPVVGSSAFTPPATVWLDEIWRASLTAAAQAGVVTAAECDRVRAAAADAVQRGEASFSVMMYAVIATKNE